MYDYFVAALTCNTCGEVSPPDSSTNMQTHLRFGADGRELATGFELVPAETRPEHIAACGYLPVAPVTGDAAMTLLETWECPSCGESDRWAAITIRDRVITEIRSVELDRESLERAHFISDQCFLRAAQLSGIPSADLMDGTVDPVNVLREHLSSGPGAPGPGA